MNALLVLALVLGADERFDRLPEKYKDWLEKEVVYIIANVEREAFLELQSEEERVAFTAAFWQRRDPDPVTPVNELKEEHYRRIEFANKYMGGESAVPGWMTDRGKMYIILGEPDDREEFTSVPFIYPAEVWFYRTNKEKGLPPLNLLFWQEHHAGPFRLFNHLLDDPEDLMPIQPYQTDDSRREAYTVLQEISPSLAHSTITMRADRGAAVGLVQPETSSLDFQTLLADINASPMRRVDTRYVDAVEDGRGVVDAAYLFNYIPSSGMANVLPGPGGTSFVHFTIEIEPQHMTLARDPDKNLYYTTLELEGEVTTRDNAEIVHSFSQEPYIQLTESQFQDVGRRAFSYRDMFPLTEGEFQLRLILKNRARAEYTMFESEIDIRRRLDSEVYLGAPVPLYGMARLKKEVDPVEPYRTYQIGSVAMDPNAQRTIAIGNFLMAHVPLQNVAPESELRISAFAAGDASASPVVEESYDLDLHERPFVIRAPLGNAAGGRYRLDLDLVDPEGRTIRSESLAFSISPRAEIPRPWAIRGSMAGENRGLVDAMLAEQELRLGHSERSRALAEGALAVNPNLVSVRLLLARFHLDDAEYRDAVRLLEPARAQAPQDVEVLLALGDAHLQTKNFLRAAELFETAATLRRPDKSLLNALGVSRAQLGDTEEAIGYLERSLELDPDQPGVQGLLDQLRSGANP